MAEEQEAVHEEQEEDPGRPPVSAGAVTLAVLGLLAGLVTMAAPVSLISAVAQDDLSLSAVQITQIYTQANFGLLLVAVFFLAGILWAVAARR
jgi:hypothetical protein